MRVFMCSTEGRRLFEVLTHNRETRTMHCRWPHGAEFDWQYRPAWIRDYFKIVTDKDDDDA
jgi:hypothetical protein